MVKAVFNSIASGLCLTASVISFANGNIFLGVLNAVLSVANLIFAIINVKRI